MTRHHTGAGSGFHHRAIEQTAIELAAQLCRHEVHQQEYELLLHAVGKRCDLLDHLSCQILKILSHHDFHQLSVGGTRLRRHIGQKLSCLREKRLAILNAGMNESRQIRIQYTSKHQGIANGWKKMIGETRGIKGFDGINKKRAFETKFQIWADSNAKYEHLLKEFENTYHDNYLPGKAAVYLTEAGMGVEIIRFAAGFRELVRKCKTADTSFAAVSKLSEKLLANAKVFYKDYSVSIDQKVFSPMMEEMGANMDKRFLPLIFNRIEKNSEEIMLLMLLTFSKNPFSRIPLN